MAFPFDTPPKELRGASLAVTFWVRVDGQVERYEVDPAISDHDYARKFDEVIRAFRFTPARAPDGSRVARSHGAGPQPLPAPDRQQDDDGVEQHGQQQTAVAAPRAWQG